ncbi:MAG: ArsB/NhaD family transporter [Anaerolineae bacterium]|nr:ArsB/NhaD family transporter [Anaerolineae bacterium]
MLPFPRIQGKTRRIILLLVLLICLIGALALSFGDPAPVSAQGDGASLTGVVLDAQDQAVCDAEVSVMINGSEEPYDTVPTHCDDGSFFIEFAPGEEIYSLHVEIEHPHFDAFEWDAGSADLARLNLGATARVETIVLERHITIAFWIATLVFVAVLVFIAAELLHNTLAALLGVAVVLMTGAFSRFIPGLFIFDFEHALSYVDFEVIFLVMGMMIVIAAIEETGIFQWLTYQSYRLSGGKVWLLVIILMCTTAVTSALLDNITTMLLMTPLTIQISLALGVNPISLLIPEVMASNVGGIATLIGTPTNILIGSYAGLGFNDFLANLTVGVLLAQAVLIIYVVLRYRKGWSKATGGELSEALLERLAEAGKIKEPKKLLRGGIVFALMIFGFVIGEKFHMAPAVIAIVGAVLMLLWVAPDVETMMQVVDWTTLMFFIALFILVGAIQEVGLLSIVAGAIGTLVGDSLLAAVLVLVWSAAILSGVIANIPFTAAMLPVVGFLTRTIPGADSMVLFYTLSVGSAMGGNSSLIGASANMVTAGISERAGYRITYMEFLKVGFPAMLLTVAVGSLWLLIHFSIFGG